MRVALCFSGQPRNVELGYPFIRDNVLDTCQPDVFVHSWVPEFDKELLNSGGHKASEPISQDVFSDISRLYRPKVMQVEPQIVFDGSKYTNKYPGINPTNSLSQRYSVKRSNGLRGEAYGPYDIVIRMRFDWAIRTRIDPSMLVDSIVAPNDCGHPGGINDQFAFGPAELMDGYSALYDHVDEYYTLDNVPFCDEILLGHHCHKQHLPVMLAPISYGLIRHSAHTEWVTR